MANWKKEIFVVEKMLDADARNCELQHIPLVYLVHCLITVHAWNYRRYILSNMDNPPPPTAELAYTTKKIEANFSNFSAWHQRSKVLTSLWEAGKLDEITSRESGTGVIVCVPQIAR